MALIINGTPANDWLEGGEYSADILDGLGGNDTISGFAGDDLLLGNMGDDLLVAGDGTDTGLGGSGNDQIWMGNGNDLADGGPGADLIGGGAGNDLLWGDNGFDAADVQAIEWALENTFGDREAIQNDLGEMLNAGMVQLLDATGNYARDEASHDTIWAGTGNDVVLGNLGNDVIGGGTGDDALSGGRGDDTIFGANGDDLIFGNDENDLIFGGNGDDIIYDGGGRDTVWGGAGDDLMFAGNSENRGPAYGDDDDTPGREDALDWDLDKCLDNDRDTFGFEGCHGDDTIMAFDARNAYQNQEDVIDLTAYGYASMDDVNIEIIAPGGAGWGDAVEGLGEIEGADGVAIITNPDCCECDGSVSNTITVVYVGEFDAGNILL